MSNVLAAAVLTASLHPSPPPEELNVPEWLPLVAWYFPEHEIQNALDIIECESGGHPEAVNQQGSGAEGLFQIKPRFWGFLLGPGESLFDPEVNVRVASVIVEAKGWRHWACKRVLAPPDIGSPDLGRVSVGGGNIGWRNQPI